MRREAKKRLRKRHREQPVDLADKDDDNGSEGDEAAQAAADEVAEAAAADAVDPVAAAAALAEAKAQREAAKVARAEAKAKAELDAEMAVVRKEYEQKAEVRPVVVISIAPLTETGPQQLKAQAAATKSILAESFEVWNID